MTGAREPAASRMYAALAAVAVIAAAMFSALGSVGRDPDLWWHLKMGEWVVAHGAVPRVEPFAWPIEGQPIVEYSWLFDVLVYGAWSLAGLHGVAVAQALASAGIAGALLVVLLRRRPDALVAGLLTALVGVAVAPEATPRPWLATMLLFTVALGLLSEARRSGDGRWLAPLPPLFALWANLHVQFVYGLFLVGAYVAESVAGAVVPALGGGTRLSARHAVLALLACVGATLLTPYGPELWGVVREYASEKVLPQVVTEMQSMRFRQWVDWLPVLAVLAVGWTLGRDRRSVEPALLLVFAVACWAAFRARRDVWFLVIPAAAIVTVPGPGARPLTRGQLAGALVAALLASAVLPFSRPTAELDAEVRADMPVAACGWIREHEPTARLFNSYGWGGYLTWCAPDAKVSMDGRANVYGDERLARSLGTWAAGPAWSSDPDLVAADVLLVPVGTPLAGVLVADPTLKTAYVDDQAVVFVRSR